MHDVYAYGVIAPSTVVELSDPFPEVAGYAEISGVLRSLGGEAGAGALVLARLGVRTKLTGSQLGTDEGSSWVIDALSSAGVDCAEVAVVPGGGVTEIVVSAGEDRTILATYGRMHAERAWSAPERADVRSSRVVCLDPFFADDSERVADWCAEDGIAYVTVDVAPESAIAVGAEILVVSSEFAQREFGAVEPTELLGRYTERCRGLVILTGGSGLVWYRRAPGPARSFPAFDVDVRDTTGAGDAFRAGAIFALLRGGSDDEIVRTASAVAAMVCATSPGVINSPTAAELDTFLAAR